jgi:hypothetical protein
MQWDPEIGSPLGQVGNKVFITILLPKGGGLGMNRCQRKGVSLEQTDVSWAGEGTFSPLANCHLLGTHGPPVIHPSIYDLLGS